MVVLGMIVLVLAAAAAGAWIARSASEAELRAAVATAPPMPVTTPRIEVPSAQSPAAGPVAPPASSAPVATAANDQAGSSAEAGAGSREGLLEVWQLTDAEQKYLQGLDVSFHVHSNDPAKRAVIINGLRAREGQPLGEDLRLEEIVPDGIILEFQGQLVHLANPQPY